MDNPLNHCVFEHLPKRTQKKLQSPRSEDKLTWDCFHGLLRLDALGPKLATALGVSPKSFLNPRLILWGFEIGDTTFSPWTPLAGVLSELECYNDGKREGQKTEPDAIVVSKNAIAVIECKRTAAFGHCSRFGQMQCPEVHLEGRKRTYCQYWDRGLGSFVTFPKPSPGTLRPVCDRHYQLLRNYMVGSRLAGCLGSNLHLMIVKAKNSDKYSETLEDVISFNSSLVSGPGFSVACWNDLRFANGKDALPEYGPELPPIP